MEYLGFKGFAYTLDYRSQGNWILPLLYAFAFLHDIKLIPLLFRLTPNNKSGFFFFSFYRTYNVDFALHVKLSTPHLQFSDGQVYENM